MTVTPTRSKRTTGRRRPASVRCRHCSSSTNQGPDSLPSSWKVSDSGPSWTVIRSIVHAPCSFLLKPDLDCGRARLHRGLAVFTSLWQGDVALVASRLGVEVQAGLLWIAVLRRCHHGVRRLLPGLPGLPGILSL